MDDSVIRLRYGDELADALAVREPWAVCFIDQVLRGLERSIRYDLANHRISYDFGVARPTADVIAFRPKRRKAA